MLNTSGRLQQIRQQILERQKGAAQKPKCPKCDHELTIDYTPYFTSEICENCFEYSLVQENKHCCVEPSFHYVKLITSSGAVQVKEQCRSCGMVKTSAVGGFTKDQKDKLPILDEKARQLRYDRVSDDCRAAYSRVSEKKSKKFDQQRQERREAWMTQYGKYLDSPEWRQKRELVLKRDNYKCQCCLTGLATQVHHKSYEFVDLAGSEPCFDLVAVCGPSHDRIEKMKAEKRKSNNL